METIIDEKEIKKTFAGLKRKVVEIAGEVHDIVEDTLWTDYNKLPILSQKIQDAMENVIKMRSEYHFLS
ncbi:MAG: CCE_0567 family metalloprotein [Sulfurovaceae bacterium]|nr:CCE_0567 family metalloprotein [Sulfurovaceae bacterium]